MINFQRILGREEQFFALLEASAQEGAKAVAALQRILNGNTRTGDFLEDFAQARRKDKEITSRLEEMLITTFVTPLEREDLEALGEALYKIPKTVEKFAERYAVAAPHVHGSDFTAQLDLMKQAIQVVLKMVRSLREANLAAIKDLQNTLQDLESKADDVWLECMSALYEPGFPSLKAVILKELFDLMEKVIDRCRDAGNVISHVLLKNS